MRNSHRNARQFVALSAAAASFALTAVQSATGQTWVNPNTGNWSVGANWTGGAAPASNAATNLVFNATGAQSYTATNNIANPFLLNSINFNNSGTGVITVAGSQLSFASAASPVINQNGSGAAIVSNALVLPGATNQSGLTFGGSGAGTLTLSGALSSSPAAAATTGAAMISDNPNGRLVLNGGGTLYGLRANRGSMFVTGGTWDLTSLQRGNDLFGAPDDGFWAVTAGNSASGGSITFSNGAKVSGRGAFAAQDPGHVGVLTFTDPGTVGTFNAGGALGRIGTNWGTGTLQIINGATVHTTRTDIGRNNGGVGTLLVNGSTTTLNAANLDIAPDENANGVGIISGGGKVILTDGANPSALAVGWATGLLGDNLQSVGNLRVTGPGSSVSVVTGSQQFSGQFGAAIGDPGVASVATITVDSGGNLDAENSFLGSADGRVAMTVDGANSKFTNRGQFLMESTIPSSLTVSNTAQWLSQGTNFTATNANDKVSITVSSGAVADLGANVTDAVAVLSGGGGATVAGGTTTITINSGGEMKANAINAAQNLNGVTNMTVDGANSKLTIAGPDAQLNLAGDNGSVANLTISNGGRTTIGANGAAFLSTGTTSIATVTVTGAGSQFDASASGAQLQVGGSGTIALGAATFNVLNNATATVNDITVVFFPGVVNVGQGSTKASLTSGSMFVDGNVFYNAGTLSTSGTMTVGGGVLLSSANRNAAGTPSNKKMLEVGQATLTSSGVIDLNDNDMLAHDNNRAKYETFVKNARNNGAWNQPGITSTAAKNSAPANKNLGVLSGAEYLAVNGTPFNGKTVVATDTVIKFTFNGDTDFNGVVNFDDYARVDSGFNNGRSGWLNGDFDYNGQVNFDDYGAIDLAFNTQGSTVLSAGGDPAGPANVTLVSSLDGVSGIRGAQHLDAIAQKLVRPSNGLQAVPEPGTLSLLAVGMLGALRRRSRRQA